MKLKLGPMAAVCFKPTEAWRYDEARAEIEELVKLSRKETSTKYSFQTDSYGYTWVLLEDEDIEDLTSTLYMISQTFVERGFGEKLLCAVFKFSGARNGYWIYSMKLGKFYPFAPKAKGERDLPFELRLKAAMESELPIEKDLEKWYPLWDLPL